jgi:hypothetical protein
MLVRGFAIAVIVLSAVGCGKQPRGTPLHGTVTFEGQPVVHGTITLHPDRTRGNKGPYGVAEINDGVFQTNPDYGMSPGPLRVTFTIYDTVPPDNHLVANIRDHLVEIPAGITEWNFNLTARDVQDFKP